MTDLRKIQILQDRTYMGDNFLNKKKASLCHFLMKNSAKNLLKIQLKNIDADKLHELLKSIEDMYNKSLTKFEDKFYVLVSQYEESYKLATNIRKIYSFCYKNTIREGRKNPENRIFVEEKEMPYTIAIKDELSKLAKINKLALDAETEKEFLKLLELPVGFNPKNIDFFLKYKLKKHFQRLEYNNTILNINDFEEYLELPNFIKNEVFIDLDDNKLGRTYFIEGLSGSGKTTLAQNIAYKLKKDNTYYIDLTDTDFTSSLTNMDISAFIEEVNKLDEIVVIDNIHFSEEALSIAKVFLIESYRVRCPIIISYQKFMNVGKKTEVTKEKFLEKIQEQDIKKYIKIIDLCNEDLSKLMIENLLLYHNKKEKKNFITNNSTLNALYKEFASSLVYINMSLKKFGDIQKLKKTDFEDFIIEEYSELISLNEYSEFKLLLLYISSYDYKFTISKDLYYGSLKFERRLINHLISKKDNDLLFKFEDEKNIVLLFPHSSIAKYIIDLICEKNGNNIYDLLIENFAKTKVFEPKLYETFFSCLYGEASLNEKYEEFVEIYNIIAKNVNIDNLLTIKAILLILKASFQLSKYTYQRCPNKEHAYCKYTRNLSTLGYKKHIIEKESEFINLFKIESVNKHFDDLIEYAKFNFDCEYDYITLYIYNILLLKSNDILTINQVLKLGREILIDHSLSAKDQNQFILKKAIEKIININIDKIIHNDTIKIEEYEELIDITYDSDSKELYSFLRNNLYSIFKTNNINFLNILDILYELDFKHTHYENTTEMQIKILDLLDNICSTYIHNELNLDIANKNIINFFESIESDIRIFKKVTNYLLEYLFNNKQHNLLICNMKDITTIEIIEFIKFLDTLDDKNFSNKIKTIIKNETKFEQDIIFSSLNKYYNLIGNASKYSHEDIPF